MAKVMIIVRDSRAGEPFAESLMHELAKQGHEVCLRSAIRTKADAERFFKEEVPKYDRIIVGNLEQMIKYQSFNKPELDLDPMEFIKGLKKALPKGRVICWEHFNNLPDSVNWERQLKAIGVKVQGVMERFDTDLLLNVKAH